MPRTSEGPDTEDGRLVEGSQASTAAHTAPRAPSPARGAGLVSPAMRWIVRPGDGRTVRDVLSRAGADGDAVSDGRVFVGPRRVRRADEPVQVGDVVQVAAAHATEEPAVTLLHTGGDFVAADKPAGIPTIPDHAG